MMSDQGTVTSASSWGAHYQLVLQQNRALTWVALEALLKTQIYLHTSNLVKR